MWSLVPWKKNDPQTALSADPFEREFVRIRNDFDQLMQRMWSGDLPGSSRWFDGQWGFDMDESDTHYSIRMEAPGFEASDFDVRVEGDTLRVKAEHKEEQQANGGSRSRYGRFERSFPLPSGAKHEEIDACYHSGILELKIPKGEEAQNVKRIKVKAS